MKNIGFLVILGALGVWFFLGSGGGSDSSTIADLEKVGDRTVTALTGFQNYLQGINAEKVEDSHLQELPGYMQRAINAEPPVYDKPVGIALLQDSTFEGFEDPNQNNTKDAGENRLFKEEIDFEGKRLIITGEGYAGGGSLATSLATGMLAGMLMGRLMGNQRAAGIGPGHYANRQVPSRAEYARSRSAATSARSRTRSGGLFGGK